MASVRVLTEDETAGGIYSLLVATLKNAKDKGLLDNEDLVSGGEERLVIYGLALLLSCPDFKLETTSPGIALPRPSESNRRLDALTCPTEFRPYFDRWAELASRLKTLSDKHAQDLALLICKKSPVTLTEQLPDPYPFFPTSEQKALREIRDLSSEISTISHAISTHASFSSLWVGKLGAALSEAPPSSNSQALAVVGHSMKTSEVLTILSQHNCPNISSDLDAASCSKNPILSDGLHSTYSGKLCDGKQVAVKVVFAYTNKKREQLIRTARELYPWSKCRHPHIVQLLGLAEFRNRTAMIFPWMDNGDIRNYVNKHPDADKFNLCTQVACGVSYLHSINIIHGDIRGFNVLVSKEGSAMLSGFRTSIVQESTVQFTSEQKIKYGALRWTAPELIKEKPDNISRATDVYALGMTILEILTGEAPYSQYPNEFACLRAALDGKLPDRPLKQIPVDGDWGNMVWALLINCWKREPKERPTAEHVHKNLKPFVVHTSIMSASDMVTHLGSRNCPNLSDLLNVSLCSEHPWSRGGYGDIYRGVLEPDTQVALKCIVIQIGTSHPEREYLKETARELYAWSKCKHQNVVQLLGLAIFRNQITMVSPWMNNGNLKSFVEKNVDADRYQLCTQVAQGLAYLHHANIVHGDIKAANVLVSDDGVAMLTDFGNAVLTLSTLKFTGKDVECRISVRWTAPEILEGSSYSRQADVYALGMTMLEVITGEVPHVEKPTDPAVMYTVVIDKAKPRRPECLPSSNNDAEKLWSLLSDCWSYERKDRPTASQVEERIQKISKDRLSPPT